MRNRLPEGAAGRWRRWVARGLVVVLVMVVAGGAFLVVVLVRRSRPVDASVVTGPYAVGRATVEWTDRSRIDPLAARPGQARELSVWLWYPAKPDTGPSAPYAPGLWAGWHFPPPVGWFETSFDAVRVHAVDEAPVADGNFPVVVLEPGLGFSAPQYTALAEELASHGYLVAGVTPTYSANLTVLRGQVVHSTPAGNPPELGGHNERAGRVGDRLVEVWAADARFVAATTAGLNQTGRFAGRVSEASVSYVGHSFGGAAALQACKLTPHCVGAVDLDGTQYGSVVRSGLRVPLMIMESEDSCVTGACGPAAADDPADRATATSLLAASTGPSWCFSIEGMRHLNFTDYAGLYVAPPLRNLLALGDIAGRRGLAVQNAYLVAFLQQVVRGVPQPLLAAPDSAYPEVRFSR